MTLSILIPTYDYNARRLVADLHALALREGVEAEILVGDDASPSGAAWLAAVEDLPSVRVLRYAANAGRAAHRNRIAEQARGQWLLFIDCDAQLPPAFSLRRYLEGTAHAPVVCGGLYHPDVNPNPEATLRYAYERAADRRRTASHRQQHPYEQLSTFNFLIRRDVFLSILFDPSCTDYGYEDTLFGVELQQRAIPIHHIDNPLIHLGLEPNAVYLAKVETSLRTLANIEKKIQHHSAVVRAARRLRALHLDGLTRRLFHLTQKKLRRNLLGPRPNLFLFKLYKLGYFTLHS